MPDHAGQLRPQRLDDLTDQLMPFAARLQMHDDLAQIRAAQRLRGGAANRRDEGFDVGIPADDIRDDRPDTATSFSYDAPCDASVVTTI